MLLPLEKFGGMAPRAKDPMRLPDNKSINAESCRFDRGGVSPLQDDLDIETARDIDPISLYIYRRSLTARHTDYLSCVYATGAIDPNTMLVTGSGVGTNAVAWRVLRLSDSHVMDSGTGQSAFFSFTGEMLVDYQLQFQDAGGDWSITNCAMNFPYEPPGPRVLTYDLFSADWNAAGGRIWGMSTTRDGAQMGTILDSGTSRPEYALDQANKYIYFFTYTDRTRITKLDPCSDPPFNVVGVWDSVIPDGEKPGRPFIDASGTFMYVATTTSSPNDTKIYKINLSSMTVTASLDIPPPNGHYMVGEIWGLGSSIIFIHFSDMFGDQIYTVTTSLAGLAPYPSLGTWHNIGGSYFWPNMAVIGNSAWFYGTLSPEEPGSIHGPLLTCPAGPPDRAPQFFAMCPSLDGSRIYCVWYDSTYEFNKTFIEEYEIASNSIVRSQQLSSYQGVDSVVTDGTYLYVLIEFGPKKMVKYRISDFSEVGYCTAIPLGTKHLTYMTGF